MKKKDILLNSKINVYFYNDKDIDEMGVKFLGWKTSSVILVERLDKVLVYLQGWNKVECLGRRSKMNVLLGDY